MARYNFPPPSPPNQKSFLHPQILKHFKKSFEEDRGTKHHILWAGCMDNQTSADAYISGDYHGAFTYYLNSHLRREPRISRRRLLEKVRASLRHGGYSQIPQLELDATTRDRALRREIFGDEEVE